MAKRLLSFYNPASGGESRRSFRQSAPLLRRTALLTVLLLMTASIAGSLSLREAFADSLACREIFERDQTTFLTANHPEVFGPSRGETLKSAMPEKFRMVVWNVHKGVDSRLIDDFSALADRADLVLFQEAIDAPSWEKQLTEAQPRLRWGMAKAFRQGNGVSTGVATAASVRPLTEGVVLSVDREPVLHTPKSISVTNYPLESTSQGANQTLMVVNVHAINFVRQKVFESFVNQLTTFIHEHRGPLIVAGDFNTWSPQRQRYLDATLGSLKAKRIFSSQGKILSLDHVYSRGIRLIDGHQLRKVRSSDHSPLVLDLQIERDGSFDDESNADDGAR